MIDQTGGINNGQNAGKVAADPGGFRAFSEKIAGYLKQVFLPEGKDMLRPNAFLGNPARSTEADETEKKKEGGGAGIRVGSSSDRSAKIDALKTLNDEGDEDRLEELSPKVADMTDDVVSFIEDANYDDALDLIEKNRDEEVEEKDSTGAAAKVDDEKKEAEAPATGEKPADAETTTASSNADTAK